MFGSHPKMSRVAFNSLRIASDLGDRRNETVRRLCGAGLRSSPFNRTDRSDRSQMSLRSLSSCSMLFHPKAFRYAVEGAVFNSLFQRVRLLAHPGTLSVPNPIHAVRGKGPLYFLGAI